jgi:hypothetical protein
MGKKIFGDTSGDRKGERPAGRGVESRVATMKTGIQYWYDTGRLRGSRSAPLREITDTTMRCRRDGGEVWINIGGTRLRCVICDDADCPCFQICACGGAYYVRTDERVVGG